MNFGWDDFLTAIALLMILEGLMPFISPNSLKKAYEHIVSLPEKTLRTIGFASIIAGVVLLFLID